MADDMPDKDTAQTAQGAEPDAEAVEGAVVSQQRETPLVELLRRAMTERLTGRLELSEGRTRRRVLFVEGLPVRVTSNLVREHLLRFLLRRQIIDQETYSRFLEQVYEGNWSRGQALVEGGALSAERLLSAEHYLSCDILTTCFGWTRTRHRFHRLPGEHPELSAPLMLDPFLLYTRWLEKAVSVRRIRRRVERLSARRMRLSALGVEHFELMQRLLTHHPKLQQSIAERWDVAQLLEDESPHFDTALRTLLAFYHLGAVELLRSEMSDIETAFSSRDDTESLQTPDDEGATPPPAAVLGDYDEKALVRIVGAELRRLDAATSPQDVLGVPPAAGLPEVQVAAVQLLRFYERGNFEGLAAPQILDQVEDIRQRVQKAFDYLQQVAQDPASAPTLEENVVKEGSGAEDADDDTPVVLQPSSPDFPASVVSRPSWGEGVGLRDEREDRWRLARILFDDGVTYLRLGDHREALACFGQSHRRDTADSRTLAYLGWCTYLCAGGEDAIEVREDGARMLMQAAQMNPDHDEIHVLLGHLYNRIGQSRRGAQMYQKALTINPDNVEAAEALTSKEPRPMKG